MLAKSQKVYSLSSRPHQTAEHDAHFLHFLSRWHPATHFVLKTEIGITKLRGRFHQMGHFVVMPTFHPAAALRNPAWQELLEEDFKMLGDYLERHPAPEDASE